MRNLITVNLYGYDIAVEFTYVPAVSSYQYYDPSELIIHFVYGCGGETYQELKEEIGSQFDSLIEEAILCQVS